MDLYCPKCSEPWDNDSIHQEVEDRGGNATYHAVAAEFRARGCEALGASHGEGQANPYASALYDLLGDDMDGAAAMMEDYSEFFG